MACKTPCARCAGPDQEVAPLGSRLDPGPTCGCTCHEVYRFIFAKPLPDGTYYTKEAT